MTVDATQPRPDVQRPNVEHTLLGSELNDAASVALALYEYGGKAVLGMHSHNKVDSVTSTTEPFAVVVSELDEGNDSFTEKLANDPYAQAICEDPVRVVVQGLNIVNGIAQNRTDAAWLASIRSIVSDRAIGKTLKQLYEQLVYEAANSSTKGYKQQIKDRHLPLSVLLPDGRSITRRFFSVPEASILVEAARSVTPHPSDRPITGRDDPMLIAFQECIENIINPAKEIKAPLYDSLDIEPVASQW